MEGLVCVRAAGADALAMWPIPVRHVAQLRIGCKPPTFTAESPALLFTIALPASLVLVAQPLAAKTLLP
jgi:hypothetical protein